MTALIFDLDGTLIDSAPDIHAAVARTLADLGADPLPLEVVRGFIGNGVPALIDKVRAVRRELADPARREPADPARRADMIARFLRHYEAASADLTTVYPGVPAALQALQDAGHVIGLCTNKPEAAARGILRAFDLLRHFQIIICGDTLAERKPHPAPLQAAVQGLAQKMALYVGDSEVDAETAMAAGVPFLLFTEGYRKTPVEHLPHRVAFAGFAALPGIVAALSD